MKTSSKRLEDVLNMSLRRFEDVLKTFCKTSWRHLENTWKTSWQDVLKTSWRPLEDVWSRRIIGLDQDVLKTSSEDVWLRRICFSWSRHPEDILKTSSGDEDERLLQDVFIKSNVWWDTVSFVKLLFSCPTANFGLLSRGQPHSVNVNHCGFTFSTSRSLRVLQQSCSHNPWQASSGVWTGYHPILITKC